MKYFFSTFAFLILCVSCETIIDLDLRQNPNLLVVEGEVNNLTGPYYVSLRYSTPFSFSDTTDYSQPASRALVIMKDDMGNSVTLSEWQPGLYRTDSLSTFRGVVGRSYSIDIITTEGKHYISKPELLHQPIPIDSLYLVYRPSQGDGSGFYQGQIDFTDPAGKGNYYRWRVSIARILKVRIDIDDDQFIDGQKINGREMVDLGNLNGLDSLQLMVAQSSLTPEAYKYLEIFVQQYESQNNAPYDIPPSPLIGNVFNADDPDDYALGYFSAYGISRKNIIIRK